MLNLKGKTEVISPVLWLTSVFWRTFIKILAVIIPPLKTFHLFATTPFNIVVIERIEVFDRTQTEAGTEQAIKICYRFGGYMGERRFLAKVLKHPCRKKECPLKKGKGYEREKISFVS